MWTRHLLLVDIDLTETEWKSDNVKHDVNGQTIFGKNISEFYKKCANFVIIRKWKWN